MEYGDYLGSVLGGHLLCAALKGTSGLQVPQCGKYGEMKDLSVTLSQLTIVVGARQTKMLDGICVFTSVLSAKITQYRVCVCVCGFLAPLPVAVCMKPHLSVTYLFLFLCPFCENAVTLGSDPQFPFFSQWSTAVCLNTGLSLLLTWTHREKRKAADISPSLTYWEEKKSRHVQACKA